MMPIMVRMRLVWINAAAMIEDIRLDWDVLGPFGVQEQ
jgi:hypothetical protein